MQERKYGILNKKRAKKRLTNIKKVEEWEGHFLAGSKMVGLIATPNYYGCIDKGKYPLSDFDLILIYFWICCGEPQTTTLGIILIFD